MTGMKSCKDYKTQLELLKEDKHNMEIKIGEMEIDNNRFKVEIDELRVARNQVNSKFDSSILVDVRPFRSRCSSIQE